MERTIDIPSSMLGTEYKKIGSGDEGRVYNYKDLYAVKIITLPMSKVRRKLMKISDLAKLNEQGIPQIEGRTKVDGNEYGYYYDLIKYKKDRKDFNYLETLKEERKILEYLLKAESIIKRLHKKGVVIGDIKPNNIMIDENGNPIFIDVDNFAIGNYPFDIVPDRAGCMYTTYGGQLSLKDNDILVFTIMALRYLTRNEKFSFDQGRWVLDQQLKKLNVSKEVRDGLEIIFSDAIDKPYFGEVFGKSM